MPSVPFLVAAISLGLVLLGLAIFAAYVWVRYSPIVGRIFEDAPVFKPLRLEPEPGGEDVTFPTADGLVLAGSYYKARSPSRTGVIVFCHEFLGDRWTFARYGDYLRDLGFDVFTFDFRNHGQSESEPGYGPLQWVSDREVRDLKAALLYLRSRPDRDPAGVGLFGVSRGGSTALCMAADDPTIWGVVTDSAFPTRGTMRSYINRWGEIYVRSEWIKRHKPVWMYGLAGWLGKMRSQLRLKRKFPNVERAVARLSPRPWLAIHGEKDTYIGPEIAKEFVACARAPKELWIVPGARHNGGHEADPTAYRDRVAAFFARFAPRRPAKPDGPETSIAPPPRRALVQV